MHPLHLRPRAGRSRTRRLLPVVLATLTLTATLTVASAPAGAAGQSTELDPYAGYEPQTSCTSGPQPGTAALARYLGRAWPGVAGTYTMRACSSGGTSEHKDGRAVDWMADVSVKRERRAGYEFIRSLLADDKHGNDHALARRLGVMYVIYDDTIWSAYRGFEPRPYLSGGCSSKKSCSRTLRHLDHVHISLSRAGGAAQTSWYRNRYVPAEPVLVPGTRKVDYAQTAVLKVRVPADGTEVVTDYKLAKNTTYRIVATSTVATDDGTGRGDAVCATTKSTPWTSRVPATTTAATVPWAGSGSPVAPTGVRHPQPKTTGLLVNGRVRLPAECRENHTYNGWVRFGTTRSLRLRYLDPTPADNSGHLTVWLARDDITTRSLVRR